jgi:hypothetical protein
MLEKLCTLEEESLTYFNCDFLRQIYFSMVPAPFVFLQFSCQHWTLRLALNVRDKCNHTWQQSLCLSLSIFDVRP